MKVKELIEILKQANGNGEANINFFLTKDFNNPENESVIEYDIDSIAQGSLFINVEILLKEKEIGEK